MSYEDGANVPIIDFEQRNTIYAVIDAINSNLLACHDISDGELQMTISEWCLAEMQTGRLAQK